MADNRLWLVHKGTGMAIMLGKRMGWGWHKSPEGNTFQAYFDSLADTCIEQDAFFLAIENNKYAPDITSDWEYTDDKVDGFRIIRLTPIATELPSEEDISKQSISRFDLLQQAVFPDADE